MYNLHLTAEQLEFRDTVRGFVNDEVKPVTLKADRLDLADRTLPLDVLRKASQMGLRALALPEDLGGVGADALTCCIVIEELAVGDTDVAAVLMETSALARRLFPAMTPEQGDRFLAAFLEDDDYHLACAEREPDEDSALGVNYHRPVTGERKVTTTATRSGNAWIINGIKDGVANAPIAKLIAIEAQTDRGPALILVPRDTPGLTVTEQPGARWYHGACGRIELKDCRVPANNLLSISGPQDPGRAVPYAEALNIGIGRAAFEAALEYSQLRVQGGRPIAQHQAIGTKLADVAIRTRCGAKRGVARGLGRRPSRRVRRPQPARPAAFDHREGHHRGSGLSRDQGRGRVLRRDGRDARHAAAEVHPRRARLPQQRRRHGG